MDFKITQTVPLPEKPRPIVSIGVGGIVKDSHYPAYKKAGFTVAGLYDVNPQRAADMAKWFDVPVIYESLADAISKAPAEAVFDVALPANVILDVLPHIPDGRSVLIQKPLGNNLEEARKIRDLCHSKNLIAAVNFQLRTAPTVNAARSLIAQGAIGDITDMEIRVTAYTPWQLWSFLFGIPRVEILYHSIHYIDLMRSFLGDPTGVYAKTIKHVKLMELASTRTTIILDYGELIRANIEVNHAHEYGRKYQESYVKWEGTHGAMMGVIGVNLNYPVGEQDSLEYCLVEDGQPSDWIKVPIDGRWFPDAFIGPMASLMRFVEGSDKEMPTSVDHAFETMAVVEAAYTSSASGGTPIPH